MTIRPGSAPMTKLPTFISPLCSLNGKATRSFSTWRSILLTTRALLAHDTLVSKASATNVVSHRNLAQVRPEQLSELWFTASFPTKSNIECRDGRTKIISSLPNAGPGKDHKPLDGRTLKLGKTLRTLSPLLPTIFTTPLPNDLLSPAMSLYLFPSTHPHLPVVKSRVPCRAALWTAPVAWGSVPLVGNVKVEIMSEKMVRTGFVSAPTPAEVDCEDVGDEKLVVRWRTEGRKNGDAPSSAPTQSLSSSSNEINRGLSTLLGGSQPLFSKGSSEAFTGLFIFSFDGKGRIVSLTIEHADESNGFDKTSKVVTLTDWLLGKARWGRVEEGLVPGLAYKEIWCRDSGQEKRFWSGKGR